MYDLVGETIANRFRLTEFLNEGAFGHVYKAEQSALGTGRQSLLAVKILKDDLGSDEETMREVQALKDCSHPNVIRFYDAGRHHCGRAKGRFFIAMELAEESLEDCLGPHDCQEPHGMPVPHVEELARQLCEGLRYLHGRKMVHRDLKPANVLKVNNQWKMSDFGLAREAGYLRTQSRLGGTPAYSPPEGQGDTLRPSFDMWSLGCLAPPMHHGASSGQQEWPVPPPSTRIFRSPWVP